MYIYGQKYQSTLLHSDLLGPSSVVSLGWGVMGGEGRAGEREGERGVEGEGRGVEREGRGEEVIDDLLGRKGGKEGEERKEGRRVRRKRRERREGEERRERRGKETHHLEKGHHVTMSLE